MKTENHFAARSELQLNGPDGLFSVPDTYTRQISCSSGEVVWHDASGAVAMTVKPLGKGRVVFFNGAVEVNAALTGWPVYAKAAELAGVNRLVRCDCREIGLTEHLLPSGETVVVAVNYAPHCVACSISGSPIEKVLRGERRPDGSLTIPANDAVVVLCGRVPGGS